MYLLYLPTCCTLCVKGAPYISIFPPIIFRYTKYVLRKQQPSPPFKLYQFIYSVSHKILMHTDLVVSKHQCCQLSALHYFSSSRHGNNLFCQVSQESFARALLVIIVYLSCQSPRSPRCSSICMGSLHVVADWLQGLAVPMPAFVLCCNNR